MFSVLTLFAASALAVAEDYTIVVDSLGVGNTWVSGVVTPLHVSVTSNISEATAAWVQWEIPNADGDTVLWGKAITLTPNGTTSTWLYAPIQPWATPTITWNIRLREWNGSVAEGELALLKFSPNSIGAMHIKSTQGIIAVFGTRRLGLAGYQPQQSFDVKQESTIIISGLQSKNLPDAWPCLETLDAIVWADTPPHFTYHQEIALQQWVERGGHLVISLPAIGDPWNLGSENGPLFTLLAGIHTSIEQIPVGYFDQILGRNHGWPAMNITTRTFTPTINPEDTSSYYPLLELNNGQIVCVRRVVGIGSVTIIGVDLSSGQLASIGLPETDVFWNRVLGRCNDTPSQRTLSSLKDNDQFSFTIPTITTLPIGNLVAQEIAMSTTASGRLGTVFILILSYWLLSGPIGYFILRHLRKQRWSWMAFAGVATTFTLLTWGMASTTAGVQTPLKHVSIIDHVYGENGQRVLGWFSLYLPTFGRSNVELEGNNNNLLLPWSSPEASLTPPFVDHREVVVNLDHVPNQFNQPSRATTANFSYEWLGGIDNPFYDSLIRVTPNNEPTVHRSNNGAIYGTLSGSIVNHATQPIRDVTVIWVTDNRYSVPPLGRYQDDRLAPWVRRDASGRTLNHTFSWTKGTWNSGELLDLAPYVPDEDSAFRKDNLCVPENSNRFFRNSTVLLKSEWRKRMKMLSLYSLLKPPTYQKTPNLVQSPPSYHAIRTGGHALDFAQWFGRPCIIVMGFIPNAPIPVHISVDGEEILESMGETFVRWVYPLGTSQ